MLCTLCTNVPLNTLFLTQIRQVQPIDLIHVYEVGGDTFLDQFLGFPPSGNDRFAPLPVMNGKAQIH
jgi:hypothetical protein